MPPNYRITGNIDVEVTLLTPQSLLPAPVAPASTPAAPASTPVAPAAQTIIAGKPAATKPVPGRSLLDRLSDLLWFVIGLASVLVVTFVCILAMAAIVDYFGIQDDFIWLFSADLLAAAILLRFPPMRRDIAIGDLLVLAVILVATVVVWYFLASDKHVLMYMF